MSQTQFDACLKDTALENQIAASRLVGEKLGVDATPTFFINGAKYPSPATAQDFEKLLSGVSEKS
jgi:protein-disulfide isomerase